MGCNCCSIDTLAGEPALDPPPWPVHNTLNAPSPNSPRPTNPLPTPYWQYTTGVTIAARRAHTTTLTCCACYACWQRLHNRANALLLHAEIISREHCA